MKIVIDGRMYGWTGIGRVTRKLLEYLPELDIENQYIVLLQSVDFDNWTPPAANFRKLRADFAPFSVAEQTGLPSLLRSLNPDLVHFLNFNLPLTYRKPYVVTIHDLTLVHYKNIRGNGLKQLIYEFKYWAMRAVLRHAVMASRRVITPTKFGQAELESRYNVAADKIQPIYLGADSITAQPGSLDRLKLVPGFLLYVGNTYPFKNVGRLVEAMPEILKKRPSAKLVIVGNVKVGNTQYFYDLLKAQAKQLGLESAVVFPGYVSEAELAALYRDAALFVFPSLAEGFGLPALEAMAAGTPVAASNASCIPEVCGDAAAYFDPHSMESIANTVSQLLNKPQKLEQLHEAGLKHVKSFSWQQTVSQIHQLYLEALKD